MASLVHTTLLLLCCIGASQAADSVIIMRHCVRSPYPSLRTGRGAPGFNSPDNYTADAFPTQAWNVTGTAVCTARGMALAAQYGAALRSHLTLPVSVRADNVTRNLQTAAALVSGLGGAIRVHPDKPLFNPVSAKVCADLTADEYNQQISTQIERASSSDSRVHSEYTQYITELEELQQLVGHGAAPALNEVALNVSGGYLTGGLYVASEGIIETFILEAGAGLQVSWGSLDGKNRSELYNKWLPLRVLYSFLNHGGEKIGARNSGAVLWRALDQLVDPSVGSEIMVGHDLTLDGIASLLDMSWQCGPFPAGATPPTAGLLLTKIKPGTVRVQAICSAFEGKDAGGLQFGMVTIGGKQIGSDGIELQMLRERAEPNMDFDCVQKFYLHSVDEEDHKCFEASSSSKFESKGITGAGKCPASYNTVDKTVTVEQCPDGVTSIRYCSPINVTIMTKGEALASQAADHGFCCKEIGSNRVKKCVGTGDGKDCVGKICPSFGACEHTCKNGVSQSEATGGVDQVHNHPDPCPYFGKPCAGSHECGWKDPDAGVAAACQHENAVCSQPEGKCMLGPP